MPRFVVPCLLAALMLATVTSAQSQATARVVRNAVILEQPRGDGAVSDRVSPGVVIGVIAQQGDWFQVHFLEQQSASRPAGWIHRSAIELMSTQGLIQLNPASQPINQVSAAAPAQRTAPSTTAAYTLDDSRGEVSVGWRFYHARMPILLNVNGVVNDFPKGGYADVAFNVSEKFAVVGEAGGTFYSDESSTGGTVSVERSSDFRLYTFMGGIRVRAPQHRTIVPFGQVLFGAEHMRSEYRTTITFQTSSTSEIERSASEPALALDGGVTMMMGPVGVRASVGYVRFFGDISSDVDALRVSLGAAFRF